MLNRNLNEIKKVFDRIESYEPTQNVGLRSLKNIGVWLCVYALTEENDQYKLINELAAKAEIKDETQIYQIKEWVDNLVKPEVLAQVIADYEVANGSFTLSVNNELNLHNLQSKIAERNYQNILSKHVNLDPSQEADLIFLMKNEIKFNWAASGAKYSLEPGQLFKVKDKFCGTEIDYLSADSRKHEVEYNLVEHNNRLFHVVRLGTLQKDEDKKAKFTNTYLIESMNPQDAVSLQKDYFEIIELSKTKVSNSDEMYELIKNGNYNNVKVIGQETDYDEIYFRVNFPQIAEPMKTTEERLGIYADYKHKVIANIFADRVQYKGVRELQYDDKGGEIKNREEFGCFRESYRREPNLICIQYTAANPFMMVYEAEKGADYYPYFISDPKKNLTLSFDSKQTYPVQQKKPQFSLQGQSMFKPSVKINSEVENTSVKRAGFNDC